MKVLVFGASGNIGSATVRELRLRGHEVTGASRSGASAKGLDLELLRADASDPEQVAAAARGNDAVISAIGPSRDGQGANKGPLLAVAEGLIEGLRRAQVERLLVVGGAASLEVSPGKLLIDTPEFPEAWKSDARDQLAVLERLRQVSDLEWTYVSPAALIGPGERTGNYRLGGQQLLVDAEGQSRISYADYALALVDELEQHRSSRRRITAAY